jgi:hypothetical protein
LGNLGRIRRYARPSHRLCRCYPSPELGGPVRCPLIQFPALPTCTSELWIDMPALRALKPSFGARQHRAEGSPSSQYGQRRISSGDNMPQTPNLRWLLILRHRHLTDTGSTVLVPSLAGSCFDTF